MGRAKREDAVDVDALFCVGHSHERGLHGYAQDASSAADMYRQAAAAGHLPSTWRLGELSEHGLGVEKDEGDAVAWYRKAADGGHALAQCNLALMLEDGRGCETDHREAFKWHLAAAMQDNALSQYCVAMCYAEGQATTPNPEASMQWLQASAKAGFGPAEDLLEEKTMQAASGEVSVDLEAGFDLDEFLSRSESFEELMVRFLDHFGHGEECPKTASCETSSDESVIDFLEQACDQPTCGDSADLETKRAERASEEEGIRGYGIDSVHDSSERVDDGPVEPCAR